MRRVLRFSFYVHSTKPKKNIPCCVRKIATEMKSKKRAGIPQMLWNSSHGVDKSLIQLGALRPGWII